MPDCHWLVCPPACLTIWRGPRHCRSPPCPPPLLSWESSASEVSSFWLLAALLSFLSCQLGDNCCSTSRRRVWLCLAPGTLVGVGGEVSPETWGEAWLAWSPPAPLQTALSVETARLARTVCPPVASGGRRAAVSGTCSTCCCSPCCSPRWSGWWGLWTPRSFPATTTTLSV